MTILIVGEGGEEVGDMKLFCRRFAAAPQRVRMWGEHLETCAKGKWGRLLNNLGAQAYTSPHYWTTSGSLPLPKFHQVRQKKSFELCKNIEHWTIATKVSISLRHWPWWPACILHMRLFSLLGSQVHPFISCSVPKRKYVSEPMRFSGKIISGWLQAIFLFGAVCNYVWQFWFVRRWL